MASGNLFIFFNCVCTGLEASLPLPRRYPQDLFAAVLSRASTENAAGGIDEDALLALAVAVPSSSPAPLRRALHAMLFRAWDDRARLLPAPPLPPGAPPPPQPSCRSISGAAFAQLLASLQLEAPFVACLWLSQAKREPLAELLSITLRGAASREPSGRLIASLAAGILQRDAPPPLVGALAVALAKSMAAQPPPPPSPAVVACLCTYAAAMLAPRASSPVGAPAAPAVAPTAAVALHTLLTLTAKDGWAGVAAAAAAEGSAVECAAAVQEAAAAVHMAQARLPQPDALLQAAAQPLLLGYAKLTAAAKAQPPQPEQLQQQQQPLWLQPAVAQGMPARCAGSEASVSSVGILATTAAAQLAVLSEVAAQGAGSAAGAAAALAAAHHDRLWACPSTLPGLLSAIAPTQAGLAAARALWMALARCCGDGGPPAALQHQSGGQQQQQQSGRLHLSPRDHPQGLPGEYARALLEAALEATELAAGAPGTSELCDWLLTGAAMASTRAALAGDAVAGAAAEQRLIAASNRLFSGGSASASAAATAAEGRAVGAAAGALLGAAVISPAAALRQAVRDAVSNPAQAPLAFRALASLPALCRLHAEPPEAPLPTLLLSELGAALLQSGSPERPASAGTALLRLAALCVSRSASLGPASKASPALVEPRDLMAHVALPAIRPDLPGDAVTLGIRVALLSLSEYAAEAAARELPAPTPTAALHAQKARTAAAATLLPALLASLAAVAQARGGPQPLAAPRRRSAHDAVDPPAPSSPAEGAAAPAAAAGEGGLAACPLEAAPVAAAEVAAKAAPEVAPEAGSTAAAPKQLVAAASDAAWEPVQLVAAAGEGTAWEARDLASEALAALAEALAGRGGAVPRADRAALQARAARGVVARTRST